MQHVLHSEGEDRGGLGAEQSTSSESSSSEGISDEDI